MSNGNGAFSGVRILLVDDFQRWREQVCSILHSRREFRVIAEAVCGLGAIEKARTVKPDLILLDIGLPNLNGLEAAKRIRQFSSDVKIIFLTQNTDKDVLQAAVNDGAQGCVMKMDAGVELLTAVDTVIGDGDFLSSGVREMFQPH